MGKKEDYRDIAKQAAPKVQKQKPTAAMMKEADMKRNNPYRRYQNEHDQQKSPVEKRKASFQMTLQEEMNGVQADADRLGLHAAQMANTQSSLEK